MFRGHLELAAGEFAGIGRQGLGIVEGQVGTHAAGHAHLPHAGQGGEIRFQLVRFLHRHAAHFRPQADAPAVVVVQLLSLGRTGTDQGAPAEL